MKKFIKNNIIGFILGLIVAGSIAGVVAYNYNAKDIEYTPKDSNWATNNVEDAINDLYNEKGKDLIDRINFSVNEVYAQYHIDTHTANLSLPVEKGSYIIMFLHSRSSGTQTANLENHNDTTVSLSMNNGECSLIDGKQYFSGATNAYSGSWRFFTTLKYVMYKCTFSDDDTVKFYKAENSQYYTDPTNYVLKYIKIS